MKIISQTIRVPHEINFTNLGNLLQMWKDLSKNAK